MTPATASRRPQHVHDAAERLLACMLTGCSCAQLAGNNGVGRIDIVESRFVGMKSRGVYETPGGTVLLAARRALESITLDRGEAHLKDELTPRYAELVYNGLWFSPERLALQAAVDQTQKYVTGTVRLKLYKVSIGHWEACSA